MLIDTFKEELLSPGNSISLKCSVEGNPLPQIIWTLDEAPLPVDQRFRFGDFVTQNNRVTSFVNITKVKPEDAGYYRCTASNEAGSVEFQKRINIYGHPSVKSIGNISSLEGMDIRINCPFYGFPVQRITWKKGN